MPHTNVSEAEHTKAGNVIRRTESQKLEEILLRKSTARISACLIAIISGCRSLAEILLRKSTSELMLCHWRGEHQSHLRNDLTNQFSPITELAFVELVELV